MENEFQSYDEFLKIFNASKNIFNVKEIHFSDMDKWSFDKDFMSLSHESGKFFKIEGIRVKTNWGHTKEWDQPIINQDEIGILGIITKVFNKKRYYLMQAKMEPGCINETQLSPTVQATKSNFSQVHKGKLPAYLEYFIDHSRGKILIDQLQSEQGGRFLRKRNRNMVIEVKEDIVLLPNFFWLTLDEIKRLMRINNFVNMDTRSIIASIASTVLSHNEHPYFTTGQVLTWYIDQKVNHELEITKIPLNKMREWKLDDWRIWPTHNRGNFSVIAVKVEADREVPSWTQPMIKDLDIGLMGFLVKEINGVKHFLVQTKIMPGNIDIVDLSPSVANSHYEGLVYLGNGPRFIEYFLNAKKYIVHLDVIQSEEGGRFYHFQNRNMIVEIPENEELDLTDEYMWITYEQIMEFIPRGMFNIESRSLIAAIDFI